jgi:hypothetical protein
LDIAVKYTSVGTSKANHVINTYFHTDAPAVTITSTATTSIKAATTENTTATTTSTIAATTETTTAASIPNTATTTTQKLPHTAPPVAGLYF